jgi:predicted NUDIX family NTP pyrophosphohydrolase
MPKLSAGILLFRRRAGVEVMLVHPGGPFWAKKDEGAWSIPKGLADEGEDLLAAAKREFFEETGMQVAGAFLDLGAHKKPRDKTIAAWACEGDFDAATLKATHSRSNGLRVRAESCHSQKSTEPRGIRSTRRS